MPQDSANIVSIDLGGTQTRVALFDVQGKILKRTTNVTDVSQGAEKLVADLADLIKVITESLPANEIAGIGLGIAAPVNPVTGLVYTSIILPGWEDIFLGKMLGERLGWPLDCPVLVDNDVNLAALGENYFGIAKGFENIVYLTVSTGVGAGIIENGRILRGANGLAGELGHITVNPEGPKCICGNVGCLSLYINGSALRKKARQGLEAGRKSLLTELSSGDLQKVDAKLVAEAARQSDPFALELIGEAAKYLGIGLTNILHIFNPQIVVIGGGLASMGDLLLQPAQEWVNRFAIPAFRQNVSIVSAQLGDDAGLYGGIALVKQNRP